MVVSSTLTEPSVLAVAALADSLPASSADHLQADSGCIGVELSDVVAGQGDARSSHHVDGVSAAGLGDVDGIALGQVDGATAATAAPGDTAPLGAVVNKQRVVVAIQPEGSLDRIGRGVIAYLDAADLLHIASSVFD